ncbi:MAG: endonuclease domain-containing protein [Rhodanobacteraceae bacterium]
MTDHTMMKQRAAALRKNQTPAERALWARLRMRNLCGVRFLRQRVVGNYILDFYAPSLRLAIELDGGQHYEPSGQRYDEHRGNWLRGQGITVLRYTNLDVSQRLDDVLSDIEQVVVRLKR